MYKHWLTFVELLFFRQKNVKWLMISEESGGVHSWNPPVQPKFLHILFVCLYVLCGNGITYIIYVCYHKLFLSEPHFPGDNAINLNELSAVFICFTMIRKRTLSSHAGLKIICFWFATVVVPVHKLTSCSGKGLPPVRRQVITCTNTDFFFNRTPRNKYQGQFEAKLFSNRILWTKVWSGRWGHFVRTQCVQ